MSYDLEGHLLGRHTRLDVRYNCLICKEEYAPMPREEMYLSPRAVEAANKTWGPIKFRPKEK